MTFGEKIEKLRKEKGLSQENLAKAIGTARRTIIGWESEGRYPRRQEMYEKLADALGCSASYLRGEEESFITDVAEKYGRRGEAQARQIIEQTAALFAGGELSDEERIAFLNEIQALYLDSKKRSKIFIPNKYRNNDNE